jgi:hypothetical protein
MALKTSKNRKAPGPDGIYLEFLKYRGLTLISRLHIVLNTCWITRSKPHTRRSARIIHLLKRDIRTIGTNIRAFSDLNSACKIHNKISKML